MKTTALLFILIPVLTISSCVPNMESEGSIGQKTKKALEFPFLEDYGKALQEAKKKGKNCLFYFTGWLSVDSRRLEDNILIYGGIKKMISKNFVYYSAYVDDKQPHPGGKGNIGEVNMQLQKDRFKEIVQPMFYIVNPQGKLIAKQGNTFSVEEFQSFLNKGIK